MQNYAIVLGGLESDYMRKLALYLKERMAAQVQVEISEKEEPQADGKEAGERVWIGSEKFIRRLGEPCRNLIILTEEEEEDETHIFRYQSREKLYRSILSRCRRTEGFPAAGVLKKRQDWLVITTEGSAGELLAFSMVCAQILGEKKQVLYINLSECCGMAELFSLERDRDLSDLFLELRKGKEVCAESFTGRIEQVDYLMPAENPMILHEINEEDMNRFLQMLRNMAQYEQIVFAVGNTLCGCGQILASADRIFHLSLEGLANTCAGNAWMHFIRKCRGGDMENTERLLMPVIDGALCGSHLIYEWVSGAPGMLARKYLENRGQEEDGSAMERD